MLQEGAKLNIYDPKVDEKKILLELEGMINEDNVLVSKQALKAAEGADAIIVLTEWEEFNCLDWLNIYQVMRKPAWVFDSRVFLDIEALKNIGFEVWSLGTWKEYIIKWELPKDLKQKERKDDF